MIKINDWKVMYWVLDITDEPMLNWTSADWWIVLKPNLFEKRQARNYVVLADENEALWDIFMNNEYVETIRCAFRHEAEARLQELLYEDDYYNWNEKDYWEFEIE